MTMHPAGRAIAARGAARRQRPRRPDDGSSRGSCGRPARARRTGRRRRAGGAGVEMEGPRRHRGDGALGPAHIEQQRDVERRTAGAAAPTGRWARLREEMLAGDDAATVVDPEAGPRSLADAARAETDAKTA